MDGAVICQGHKRSLAASLQLSVKLGREDSTIDSERVGIMAQTPQEVNRSSA